MGGSLAVCTVFGQELYVDGSQYSTLSNDNFLPAWMVPMNDKAATMEVGKDTFKLEYTYKNVMTDAKIEPEVTVHYLIPKKCYHGKHDVVLTRQRPLEPYGTSP